MQSSNDEIEQLLDRMEQDAKALKDEALRIVWWMRGMSYLEVMNLSFDERKFISKLIEENMESSKKSGQMIY